MVMMAAKNGTTRQVIKRTELGLWLGCAAMGRRHSDGSEYGKIGGLSSPAGQITVMWWRRRCGAGDGFGKPTV
jgi:hypothetical protein